jgi:hypothetical protein
MKTIGKDSFEFERENQNLKLIFERKYVKLKVDQVEV